MSSSIESSYFGKSQANPISFSTLKAKFRRCAPSIISFCHEYAKKCRSRHEYQSILFPGKYQEEPREQSSKELKECYRKYTQYPFFLSEPSLFIDNYYLRILKKEKGIPIQVSCLGYGNLIWFAEWLGAPKSDYIVGVTDLNWVILVSIKHKNFFRYRIQKSEDDSNKEIVSVNCHERFIYIFSKNEYHILKYQNDQNQKLELALSRKMCSHINKGYGISVSNSFFIFVIDHRSAAIWKPEQGILKIDFLSIPFHDSEDGSIINNFAVHLNGNIVTAAFGSHSQVIVKTYNIVNSEVKSVAKKENIYCRSVNRKKEYVPYINFIDRQNYILLAIGFRYKLFFMKIGQQQLQISRRVKFPHRIEMVSSFGEEPGILVVLENTLERIPKKVIIVTHENKIALYSSPVNLTAMEKYTTDVDITNPINNTSGTNRSSLIYNNNQVFFLQKCSILRVALTTWQDIYNEMKIAQNIKLLHFLILLKMIPSPFLKQPKSFDQLEIFFDLSDDVTQQILLEYYYIINMPPARIDVSRNPKLFFPFIMNHKIDNLSKEQEEALMNWCLKFDERLVEEMIIGGAECGWQYAVKNGWVRAFKVMVDGGMEIQMPILKLYSMAIYRKTVEVNKILNKKREVLTPEGQKYLSQMIEYIKFVLNHYFIEMVGDGKNVEFRQVFFIIFKPETWNFLIKFAPEQAVGIITALFMHKGLRKEVSYYQARDIKMFRQTFKEIVPNDSPKNVQIIFSHLSQTFRRQSIDAPEALLQEHSKFMFLKFKKCLSGTVSIDYNHSNTLRIYQLLNLQNLERQALFEEIRKYKEKHLNSEYFNFKKDYLKQMLLLLIRYDHKILKQVFDFFSELSLGSQKDLADKEERLCLQRFFLVYVWIEIYIAIIEEVFRERKKESDAQVRKRVRQEVRLFLSDVEERNYQSSYLIIHLKLSINSADEYTANILRAYLQCRCPLLKARVFFWIRKMIPHSASLQEEFIIHLKELILIDKEQSKIILETFFEGREKQIIKKLDHDSALQLEYVELVIQGGDETLENYYTNLHVELILKLTPWELIDVIKNKKSSVEYDISQALKMVEASKQFPQKNDILIFFYEMEGQIMKCIETFLSCFELSLMKYIEVSEKSRQQQLPLDNSLLKTSNDTKDWSFSSNCQRELNNEVLQLEKKFFQLVQLIYRQMQVKYQFVKTCLNKFSSLLGYILSSNHKFKSDYLNLITIFFGNFMVQIFQHNYLHYLSRWIEQYDQKTECLTQLQSYVIDIYDKIYIHLSTLKSTIIMDRKVLVQQIGQTLKKLQFCISSNAFCIVCLQEFKNQDAIIQALLFNCGHLYHKSCIQPVNGQDYCYCCVSLSQYRSMIEHPQLNLVDLLEKFKKSRDIMRRPGAKIDIIQKQTLLSVSQKRKNRMRLFDKKVASIETQAQIIDLKMVLEQYFDRQSKL